MQQELDVIVLQVGPCYKLLLLLLLLLLTLLLLPLRKLSTLQAYAKCARLL
jgi:hypothetical protein